MLPEGLNFLESLVIGDKKLHCFSQTCTNLLNQSTKNVLGNAQAKAGAFVCRAPAERWRQGEQARGNNYL